MARINIIHSSHEGRVPLNLNGDEFILLVPRDGKGEADVPDKFLPLLTDSNIEFEIVASDEAGAGARGDSGAAPAESFVRATDQATTADVDQAERGTDAPAGDAPGADDKREEPSLLDSTVPEIVEMLHAMSREEIEGLLADERAGKSRSTLITALEEALADPE